MSEPAQRDARLELWSALGQVIPHVESPDTLGTIIATALHEMIGTGRTAVLLQNRPLASENHHAGSKTFLLRPIGDQKTPSHPIYLDGETGLLAELRAIQGSLRLEYPWPDGRSARDDRLLQLASRSIDLIPIPGAALLADELPPGAICLIDVPASLRPSEMELVALASYTGVALDLLTSKAEAARQAIEYSIISEIGHSLTSTLSLDGIFEQILSSVTAAIDASEVSVGLINRETGEITLEKSLMGPKFSALPPFRLKLGQGVAGWVAETGQAVNIPDAYQDPRFFQGVDDASGFVTRSILCVPLTVEGQVIGIMEAVNKRSGHFTEADKRLLSALAASAAVAIEKANLHSDVLAEKRRMDAIFANMGEGLMTVSISGRITNVNPALQAMIGSEEGDLIGQLCQDAIRTDPDIMTDLLHHIGGAEVRGASFHAAGDLLRPEGSRVPVLVNGAATVGEAGESAEIVVVFSDISQIRELERMKDDFVTNVTHELRTPLAAILLYARLLRSGKAKDDPERERRYLEIVEQQSNQLQKLVRKILDLSRMEATLSYAAREQISLSAMLGELIPPFAKIAQHRGVELQTELPDDLPLIFGNGEGVRLAIKNLIDNAIKFTLRGRVRVRAFQSGDYVQVDVSDEGIGIAPESIPHLFQRFYRTQAAVERGIGGTGLGLALVKEAVEKTGGTIHVTSQLGQGSTFTVSLPVYREAVQDQETEVTGP